MPTFLKFFVKLITEAYDPLALVTISANAESIEFQRKANFLFLLLPSITLILTAGCLMPWVKVMVSKEESKSFSLIHSKVQPSKKN